MSAKTKIIVVHMKEVIYTGIFLLLAVILAIVLFFMFGPGQKKSASADAKSLYKPGIYTSSIDLNENTFDLEVTVDADRITSIRLVNLSESTAAMFPLMEPALESLASQIYTSQSLENIQYSEDQKNTSMILLNAIETALKKADNNFFYCCYPLFFVNFIIPATILFNYYTIKCSTFCCNLSAA